MKRLLCLSLYAGLIASASAQILVYNPTFSGHLQSDMDLGGHAVKNGSLSSVSVPWSLVGGVPTTLAGFGITDPVTLQGNSFNGTSQLVRTLPTGELPSLSGANLTSLNASHIGSGILPDTSLPTAIARQDQANVFTLGQSAPSLAACSSASNADLGLYGKGLGGVMLGGGGYATTLGTQGVLTFNNGSSNPPGIRFCSADHQNYGIDAVAGILRFSLNLWETGFLQLGVWGPGGLSIAGAVQGIHLGGNGSSPALAAGAGAGASPTGISLSGNDAAGTISLTTGTTPASGTICTVTFSGAYASTARIVFSPANNAAAALSGNSAAFVSSSTGSFSLSSGTAPLPASTAYKWNYIVMQ